MVAQFDQLPRLLGICLGSFVCQCVLGSEVDGGAPKKHVSGPLVYQSAIPKLDCFDRLLQVLFHFIYFQS
jgi:anthranilate/para-aminobenzoate synthase component II